MLEHAKRAFEVRRILAPVIFVVFVILAASSASMRPTKTTLLPIVGFWVFVAWVGMSLWRMWVRPRPKGDIWYAAGTIPYENDIPRDVQRKIDALCSGQRSAESQDPTLLILAWTPESMAPHPTEMHRDCETSCRREVRLEAERRRARSPAR